MDASRIKTMIGCWFGRHAFVYYTRRRRGLFTTFETEMRCCKSCEAVWEGDQTSDNHQGMRISHRPWRRVWE